MRTLHVFVNADRVGELVESETVWTFRYDEEWMRSAQGFDLSPALSRSKPEHVDGGTDRPVQWYFDNLLPEEGMRQIVHKEANIQGQDAFALLAYLGAESAGSLTLLPPGQQPPSENGYRPILLKNSSVSLDRKDAATMHVSERRRRHDREVAKGSSTPQNLVSKVAGEFFNRIDR